MISRNSILTKVVKGNLKKQLAEQSIQTVVWRNDSGRIYGIMFIDHESRTVWNGSVLDRKLSANVFNNWWNNGNKPEIKVQDSPVSKTHTTDDLPTKDLFEFIPQEHSPNFDLGLFSLLPDAQEEDYKEEQFANRMKKKRRGCEIFVLSNNKIDFISSVFALFFSQVFDNSFFSLIKIIRIDNGTIFFICD